MKKLTQSRFEVDYKERSKQSQEAKNNKLSLLGYARYRVYVLKDLTYKTARNNLYGSQGMKTGPLITARQGHKVGRFYTSALSIKLLIAYEGLYNSLPLYHIKWLKPKHVTLLRMKGHTVELAEAGDRSTIKTIYSGPVSIRS